MNEWINKTHQNKYWNAFPFAYLVRPLPGEPTRYFLFLISSSKCYISIFSCLKTRLVVTLIDRHSPCLMLCHVLCHLCSHWKLFIISWHLDYKNILKWHINEHINGITHLKLYDWESDHVNVEPVNSHPGKLRMGINLSLQNVILVKDKEEIM